MRPTRQHRVHIALLKHGYALNRLEGDTRKNRARRGKSFNRKRLTEVVKAGNVLRGLGVAPWYEGRSS